MLRHFVILAVLAMYVSALPIPETSTTFVEQSQQIDRQVVDGVLNVNLTMSGVVVNPLQWVQDGNAITTTFQDDQGRSWILSVQPRGTQITVSREVESLHAQMTRLETTTTCFSSRISAEPDSVLANQTGLSTNVFLNDDALANSPTRRRILSADEDGSEYSEPSPTSRKLLATIVDSDGMEIETRGSDSPEADTFLTRSRENCRKAIMDYFYNGIGSSAPGSTETGAPPPGLVADVVVRNFQTEHFRNMQLTLGGDPYGKKLFPKNFCRFAKRPVELQDKGPVDTEVMPCTPRCIGCTDAERAKLATLSEAEFESGTIRAKLQALSFINENGAPRSSPNTFETEIGGGPGVECYCSPRNDEAYRTCALNPWSEPTTGGRIQKCLKAPGQGFYCVPIQMEAMRRPRSKTITASVTCSWKDKLSSAFSSWKCVALVAGAYGLAGQAVMAAADTTVTTLVPSCGCQDRHETYNDDSVRYGEQRVLANALLSDQTVLEEMLALQETSLIEQNAILKYTENVTVLINAQSDSRRAANNLYDRAFRVFASNMSVKPFSLSYLGAVDAGNYIKSTFADINVPVSGLQASFSTLQQQDAAAFAVLNPAATALLQNSQDVQDNLVNVAKLVATTRDSAKDITAMLFHEYSGSENYRATVANELHALGQTRSQRGWIPLASNYNSTTGHYGFPAVKHLPIEHLRFQLDAHTVNSIVPGGRIVQGIWEIDCRADFFARLETDIIDEDDVKKFIGPQGCDMNSALFHPASGVCACIVSFIKSECDHKTSSITTAEIARILQGTNAPLSNPQLSAQVCKSDRPVRVNATQTFDNWSALSSALVQSCKNLSSPTTPLKTLFRDYFVNRKSNRTGFAVVMQTRQSRKTVLDSTNSETGACAVESDARRTGMILNGGKIDMVGTLLRGWADSMEFIRGTEQTQELRFALQGAPVQIGVSRYFYTYGRTQTRIANGISASYQANAKFVAPANADDEAAQQIVRDANAKAFCGAVGVPGTTFDDFSRIIESRMNLSQAQRNSIDLPSPTLGANHITRGLDCVDSSFLSTSPDAVPRYRGIAVNIARPISISLRLVANETDQAVAVASMLNVTAAELLLMQDILMRINANSVQSNDDDGKALDLLNGIIRDVGFAHCFAGSNPCDLPMNSVTSSALENNNATTGGTAWFVYDLSPADSTIAVSLTGPQSHLRLNIGKYDFLHKVIGPDGVYDPVTNASVYDGNITRIPMFDIQDIVDQHGLDTRLPQSSLLGFVPKYGAVSLEQFRTQVLVSRSQYRSIDGNLHSSIRFRCIKAESRKGTTCQRFESFVLLTDPELYDGETDPDRWKHFVYQPVNEILNVALEMPASTVLAATRAQSPCPFDIRIDRGRSDTDAVLRLVRPVTARGSVVLLIQAQSHLGDAESFELGQGCDKFAYNWVLNDTSEVTVSLRLPSPCTLSGLQISRVFDTGAIVFCRSHQESLDANVVSILTPSKGELAIHTLDIRTDRSDVAMNLGTLRMQQALQNMQNEFSRRLTAGLGLAVAMATSPTTPTSPGSAISNTTDTLSPDEIADILKGSVVRAWNASHEDNDTEFARTLQEYEDTYQSQLDAIAGASSDVAKYIKARAAALAYAAAFKERKAYLLSLFSYTSQFLEAYSAYIKFSRAGAFFGDMTPEGWAMFAKISRVERKNPGTCLVNFGARFKHEAAMAKAIADYNNRKRAAPNDDTTIVDSNPMSWTNGIHDKYAKAAVSAFAWIAFFLGVIFAFLLIPALHPRSGVFEDIAQSLRPHQHSAIPKPKQSPTARSAEAYDSLEDPRPKTNTSGRRKQGRHAMVSDAFGNEEEYQEEPTLQTRLLVSG